MAEGKKAYLKSKYTVGTEANYLFKEIAWDTQKYPWLQWRWRVEKFPKGAKILDSNLSDAGAQVYMPGQVAAARPPKHFWATQDPIGTKLVQGNAIFGRLYGEVIRSGGPTGVWHTEVRNVYEDFKKAFGDPPPAKAQGIAVLSDGDQTNTEAEADFDDFEALQKKK